MPVTAEEYIAAAEPAKQAALTNILHTIRENIPAGFAETINYNMIGYVVPLEQFPEGYLNDGKTPLPYINLAAQKNYIALYFMSIAWDPKLCERFIAEYQAKDYAHKINVGKSCIRLKYPDEIPYDLIAGLAKAYGLEDWVAFYKRGLAREK